MNKEIAETIIVEALLALTNFEKTGSRKEFKEWQEKWKEELDLIHRKEKISKELNNIELDFIYFDTENVENLSIDVEDARKLYIDKEEKNNGNV